MIQQSYFLGGGLRLKFEDQDEDKASYILIGNYPNLDSSETNNWNQYGKLILISDTQKDLL